jgi:hypothetical protein
VCACHAAAACWHLALLPPLCAAGLPLADEPTLPVTRNAHACVTYAAAECRHLFVLPRLRAAELPLEDKLNFLREARHAFGRTALVLSGGGSFGAFHLVRPPALLRASLCLPCRGPHPLRHEAVRVSMLLLSPPVLCAASCPLHSGGAAALRGLGGAAAL